MAASGQALASVGLFTESAPGSYGLTLMAALLQTGIPGSMRALAIIYGEEQYRAWGDVLHSIKTGEIAFERQFGTLLAAILNRHGNTRGILFDQPHVVAAAAVPLALPGSRCRGWCPRPPGPALWRRYRSDFLSPKDPFVKSGCQFPTRVNHLDPAATPHPWRFRSKSTVPHAGWLP